MRKTMTPPELALWFQLRALRSKGWHFRRQSAEGPYILDFVCRRQKLVVEADGIQHADAGQTRHDAKRDAYLRSRGFRVIRFWASDIQHELDGVMSTIVAALDSAAGPAGIAEQPTQSRVGGRYGQLVRLGLRRRPSAKS